MKDIILFLPEVYVLSAALGILVSEITEREKSFRFTSQMATLGLLGAGAQVLLNYELGITKYFYSFFISDAFSLFFKLLILFFCLISIFSTIFSKEILASYKSEQITFYLVISAMAMFLVSSTNVVFSVFILLGTLILSYLLLAFKKRSAHAVFGAIHAYVGLVFVFFFLFLSVVLLYQSTHTLDYYEIHKALSNLNQTQKLCIDFAFVSLLFSISIIFGVFPGYQTVLGYFQSASTPTFGFLSGIIKVCAIGFFSRVVITIFLIPAEIKGQWLPVELSFEWTKVLAVLASATMITAAAFSLRPQRVQKFFVSLWMFQSGFLLIGFLAFDEVGFSSMLYSVATDLISMGGALAALSALKTKMGSDQLKDIRGAIYRATPESAALILFLCNLLGVPPFPGFINKFTLISSVMRHGWSELAAVCLLGVLLTWISAAEVLMTLLAKEKNDVTHTAPLSKKHRIALLLCLAPLLAMTVFSEWVLNVAGRSVQFILW